MSSGLALTLRPGAFSIVRLGLRSKVPPWAMRSGLVSVTRTPSELSIVCRGNLVPNDVRREDGFRCLEVKGPLEDPRVKLLPMKSVTSGVGALALLPLDIMKSVFFLPKELLAPSKRPPSPCAVF